MNFYFRLFLWQQYQHIKYCLVQADLIAFFRVFIFRVFIFIIFLISKGKGLIK